MTSTNPWGRSIPGRESAPYPDDLAARLVEAGLCAADAEAAVRGLQAGRYLTVADAVAARQLWSHSRHLNHVDEAKVAALGRSPLEQPLPVAEQPFEPGASLVGQVAALVRESSPHSYGHGIKLAEGVVLFGEAGGRRAQRFSVGPDGRPALLGASWASTP